MLAWLALDQLNLCPPQSYTPLPLYAHHIKLITHLPLSRIKSSSIQSPRPWLTLFLPISLVSPPSRSTPSTTGRLFLLLAYLLSHLCPHLFWWHCYLPSFSTWPILMTSGDQMEYHSLKDAPRGLRLLSRYILVSSFT